MDGGREETPEAVPTPTVRRIEPDRRRPRPARRPPVLRPATPEDLAACASVWEISIADYERRLNRPVIGGDLGPIVRLLEHLRSTDPDRFWVATRPWEEATEAASHGGRPLPPRSGAGQDGPDAVVGFGSAVIRGDVWFLSMLFILPEEQARGLGRELLARVFPGGVLPVRGTAWRGVDASGAPAPSVLATATDSVQPISNALYARFGMVPRLPVFGLVGRPERPGILPALPEAVAAEAFDAIAAGPPGGTGHRALVDAVGSLDRDLLGWERPADHRYLRLDGRTGYLYRGRDGSLLGYGYVARAGKVGPVLVREPALLTPVVGHLLHAVEPRGASSVHVSGATPELFRALLEAGLRLEGFPALFGWTAGFLPIDRYVVNSLALP